MSQAVVFGEILFDVFADGECLGGAPLNCGWYLRQFGIDVQMVSAMGNDQRGEQARKLMQEAGMSLALAGDLVMELPFDGRTGVGTVKWDLVSRNLQDVTSGVYIYSVETEDTNFARFISKFVVIR